MEQSLCNPVTFLTILLCIDTTSTFTQVLQVEGLCLGQAFMVGQFSPFCFIFFKKLKPLLTVLLFTQSMEIKRRYLENDF